MQKTSNSKEKPVLNVFIVYILSGKQLDCRPASAAVDLKQLCSTLRHRTQSTSYANDIPDSAFDLLHRLLDLNPFSRVTAANALKHPFVADAE